MNHHRLRQFSIHEPFLYSLWIVPTWRDLYAVSSMMAEF